MRGLADIPQDQTAAELKATGPRLQVYTRR